MPHYNIVEATKAVKPVLGEYFKEPEKSGILPFHLIKQYFKGAKVSVTERYCRAMRLMKVSTSLRPQRHFCLRKYGHGNAVLVAREYRARCTLLALRLAQVGRVLQYLETYAYPYALLASCLRLFHSYLIKEFPAFMFPRRGRPAGGMSDEFLPVALAC